MSTRNQWSWYIVSHIFSFLFLISSFLTFVIYFTYARDQKGYKNQSSTSSTERSWYFLKNIDYYHSTWTISYLKIILCIKILSQNYEISLTMKIMIWNKNAKITSVAFLSKETVDAFSNWRALVKQTWTTKLSNPFPISMLQSLADVGNICFVAISPSTMTAAINVEKNPMHPNTESTVDQWRSNEWKMKRFIYHLYQGL